MSDVSTQNPAFLNRFRLVWARKRRVALGQILVASLLLAVIGLGCVSIADYAFELERSVRVFLLVTVIAAVGLFAVRSLVRAVRRWNRPTTAAEIEAAFPQLGQSVRTTVQFGDMRGEQIQSEGVATTLVTALTEDTHQRALPLTIEDVVPTRKLGLVAGCLAAGVLLLVGAATMDWQWRNATQRAVLHDAPYRQLEVLPGNETVDEGTGLRIQIDLVGRTNREVVLLTRPADVDQAEWTERKLEAPSTDTSSHEAANESTEDSSIRPRAQFVTKLDRTVSIS